MSRPFPCGTPSTTSTKTTSASSLSAMRTAQFAPTLPAPTTVTFFLIDGELKPNYTLRSPPLTLHQYGVWIDLELHGRLSKIRRECRRIARRTHPFGCRP